MGNLRLLSADRTGRSAAALVILSIHYALGYAGHNCFEGDISDRWAGVAIGFVCFGVVAKAMMLMDIPWVSLALAGTFSLYAVLRKKDGFRTNSRIICGNDVSAAICSGVPHLDGNEWARAVLWRRTSQCIACNFCRHNNRRTLNFFFIRVISCLDCNQCQACCYWQ